MSPRVAIQLYTLREEPRARLPEVLDRLAAMGFDGVEPAGFWGCAPAEFRRECEAAGLAIPAAHVALPLEGGCEAELAQLGEARIDVCVLPMLGAEEFADRERVMRAADRIQRAAERAAQSGIELGYHNHQWEFESRIDGVPAHRLLFEQLDASVFAEIDVYWAQVGGVDPALEIERLGPRARLLHMKDGPADDPDADMTALGEGAIDLQRILERSSAEWHIVEIDRCRGDLWDAIGRSCAYLKRGAARPESYR